VIESLRFLLGFSLRASIDRLAPQKRAGGVPFPSRWIARVERWTRLEHPDVLIGVPLVHLDGKGWRLYWETRGRGLPQAREAFHWGMGLGFLRVKKQKNRSGVGAVFSLFGFGME